MKKNKFYIEEIEINILKRLKKKAMEIKDNRIKRKCTYKLWDVVVLCILAILSNAQDWQEIELFGKTNKKYLRKFLKLTGGIPPAKTIENIISTVNSQELTRITVDFINEVGCNQFDFQTEKVNWFEEYKEWKGLKSFTYVSKKMEDLVTGEITKENRYYISSLLLNIREVSLAIRNHWQVENKLHWHLDFTFKLDDNKTLNKKALLNFEIITKLCLKILNIVKKEYNISLKKIRYKISLNVEEEINNIFKILAKQKEIFKI